MSHGSCHKVWQTAVIQMMYTWLPYDSEDTPANRTVAVYSDQPGTDLEGS